MGKKLIALLLIVCIIAPSLFADATDDALVFAAPTLLFLGVLAVAAILVPLLRLVFAEADVPSDGLYLVSDDGSPANHAQEKDSIFNHIMPVVDYRPSPTGNNMTHIGIRLSF